MECFHHAERFENSYHDPRAFRFDLNALLAAVSSVGEIAQKEIEKRGDIAQWNAVREPFKSDRWLGAVRQARNATLHQRAIFDGSRVHIGLYRGRRHKLSLSADVRGDLHSADILRRWSRSDAGLLFLDPEHSAIGEQYGVWRTYWIDEISDSEDVLLVMRRALIRTHDLLVAAHRMYEVDVKPLPDDFYLSAEGLAQVNVLLESDVDPTLPKVWGWE